MLFRVSAEPEWGIQEEYPSFDISDQEVFESRTSQQEQTDLIYRDLARPHTIMIGRNGQSRRVSYT
jgi:hypothetical protein